MLLDTKNLQSVKGFLGKILSELEKSYNCNTKGLFEWVFLEDYGLVGFEFSRKDKPDDEEYQIMISTEGKRFKFIFSQNSVFISRYYHYDDISDDMINKLNEEIHSYLS